jgi:hypothetical protein
MATCGNKLFRLIPVISNHADTLLVPMYIYDGYGPCKEPHHGSETPRRSEILCVTLKFRLFGFHFPSAADRGCFGEKFRSIEDCEVTIMRHSA